MYEAGSSQCENEQMHSAKESVIPSKSDQITLSNPQEAALQLLCKQLLRSRLFRGNYLERRFVQPLESYRDVILLHRSERELGKLLLDICCKLQLFYSNSPNMWIGVTHGPILNSNDICIWVELDELAFGQYWFSIKSVRFRQNEILLKLKVVREVEEENSSYTPLRQRKQLSAPLVTETFSNTTSNQHLALQESTATQATNAVHIDFDDFVGIVRQWGISIKHTIYEFMSQDINKENIIGVLRFLGLLLFSVLSGAVVGIKFLGIFTLRFMYEFSRLTHVMTPIILKIIEFFNKIVGGFYILIAMIWKDTVAKKADVPPQGIPYNRPLYKAIKYDVQERQRKNFQ